MNYTKLHKLLKKYRQQDLTKEEEASLLEWYNELDISSADHATDHTRLRKEEAYETIQKQLFGKESFLEENKVTPFYTHLYFKIVAAIMLFFTIGYFFYPSKKEEEKSVVISYKTIDCPEGKRMKVTLPDSSQIWLQGGTSLKYMENFATNRHILLEKGEAFFEVRPDSVHPFL